MKAASDALIALMARPQTLQAHLLTITTKDGDSYYFTDGDRDISANGHTFSCDAVQFERGTITTKRGLEVETLDLTLYAQTTDEVGGVPIIQAIANGLLDGATILLERAYMKRWGDVSAGTLYLFSGRVADVSASRYQASITVKSWLELLDAQLPRNRFQPTCPNELFDTSCALLKASFEQILACQASSTDTILMQSTLTQADNYWQLGRVVFTSGTNVGARRQIRSSTSGSVTLISPLPHTPSVGDTFKIIPGCDKTFATCGSKFSNTIHFRGCPAMPDPSLLT